MGTFCENQNFKPRHTLPFSSLAAVEEVLDPETDSLVPERTYGCLPADEQVNIVTIVIISLKTLNIWLW